MVRSPTLARRTVSRSFVEILQERRAGPPQAPEHAAGDFLYVLARELLRREARPDRVDQVVRDFEDASRALVQAAANGATWEEQAEILQDFWKRFELPERDLRKRKEVRGPTDAQLRREFEALLERLSPILRSRKKKPRKALVQELRELAPSATKKALREAAESAPKAAACTLLGSRYHLGPSTVRNRISRARKRT